MKDATSGTVPEGDGGTVPRVGTDAADGALVVVSTAPSDEAPSASRASDLVVAFSADMDPESTIAAMSFSPALPCDAVVSGAVYTCAHGTLQAATTYTVSVATSAHDLHGRALAAPFSYTFTTTPPGTPTISSVRVEGQLGAQVRQGVGTVTLDLLGVDLDGATSATVGPLQGTITSSATAATIVLDVPVTQLPGKLQLGLTTPHGSATFDGAIEVVYPSVDPALGDDANPGTTEAPFRTLTYAMSHAASPARILLADGTYSSASGEVWPTPNTTNVPDGTLLIGHTSNAVLLKGDGGTSVALSFAGTATVINMDISGFGEGVVARGSAVASIGNIHIHDNLDCGALVSGTATLGFGSAIVEHNGGSGVMASGNATVSLGGATFRYNRTGAWLSGYAKITGQSALFANNGFTKDATNSGLYLSEYANADLVYASFQDNFTSGIDATAYGHVNLTGGEVSGNGKSCTASQLVPSVCGGIVLKGLIQDVTIDGTKIHDNTAYGVVAIGGHITFTLTNATVSANQLMNVVLAETGSHVLGWTTAVITNSTFTGPTSVNLWYGGELSKVTLSNSRFSGGQWADLESDSSTATTLFGNVTIDGVLFPSDGSQSQNISYQTHPIPAHLVIDTQGSMFFYKIN
ncbi:MAG: right-handed parallel beta-helix repeat-containing protein [Polyangia bacterium]